MRIDPISGMPSEVERPATTGAVAAAATEIRLHSNQADAPVTAVPDIQKDVQSASKDHGESVWLEDEKRQVFRIVDQKNGEVVCQVPSDEVLRVARNLKALVDEPKERGLDITS